MWTPTTAVNKARGSIESAMDARSREVNDDGQIDTWHCL
jgi:hypothetical protein